jgi:RNA polymerase sigma-70 factor (ECF subfamily)
MSVAQAMALSSIPAQDRHERALVEAVLAGDRSAFRELYDSYRDRVFNLAAFSLGDASLAEDVLQAVFLSVHRALPTFRFEASLATWIYRITLNECAARRKRPAKTYVPLEALLGSGEEIDPDIGPDEQLARTERQEILQRAVMELSPKLRTVVILRYVEGLSYEEIGAVLDCSPGTVASRLHRALAELERRLHLLKRLL